LSLLLDTKNGISVSENNCRNTAQERKNGVMCTGILERTKPDDVGIVLISYLPFIKADPLHF